LLFLLAVLCFHFTASDNGRNASGHFILAGGHPGFVQALRKVVKDRHPLPSHLQILSGTQNTIRLKKNSGKFGSVCLKKSAKVFQLFFKQTAHV